MKDDRLIREGGEELLRKALEFGHLMLKRVTITEQRNVGEEGEPYTASAYVLYHESFRDHLLASDTVAFSVKASRRSLVKLVAGWPSLQRELFSFRYALRFGVEHLIEEAVSEELDLILTNLAFLEAKCSAGMTFELERDLRNTLDRADSDSAGSFGLKRLQVLRALASFVSRRSHILAREPSNLLQEAWNYEAVGEVAATAQAHIRSSPTDYPWIRRVHRPSSSQPSPLQRTFEKPQGFLRGLAISPSGDFAAARYGERSGWIRKLEGQGTSIEMLDLTEGRVMWKKEATVRSMVFWQDRQAPYLLTGESGGSICVWDVRTGCCTLAFCPHTGDITALAGLGDTDLFASGYEDGIIAFWSSKTGTCQGTVAAHKGRVRTVSFVPDENVLVSTGDDNRMLAWDATARNLLGEFEWYTGEHEPRSISLSAMVLSFDTRVLATGVMLRYGGSPVWGVNANIRLWDVQTGRCLSVLQGHVSGVSCLALSQDGLTLVSAGFDHTWKVWKVGTGSSSLVRQGKNYGTAAALTADGRLAISGEFYGDLELWETDTGRVLQRWDGPQDVIEYISITPEGSIAIVRTHRTILILHANLGRIIFQSTGPDRTCIFRIARDEGGEFRCIRTSQITPAELKGWELNPDGRMAFRAGNGFFEIWDVAASRHAAVQSEGGRDRELAYRGSRYLGDRVIGVTEGTGFDETHSIIWDALENKPLARLEGHKAQEALFSVGGAVPLLITRDEGGLIHVWQLDPLSCLRILPGHMDIGFDLVGRGEERKATRIDAVADLPKLAIAADSCQLLTLPSIQLAHSDGELGVAPGPNGGRRVYHIRSCRRWDILSGKDRSKEQLRFSVDGKLAVSAGFDEPLGLSDEGRAVSGGREIARYWNLRLWDRATCACIQECTGIHEDIAFLAADTQLKRVLTGYHSGTTHVWQLAGNGQSNRSERDHRSWALSSDGRLLVDGPAAQPVFHDLLTHSDSVQETGRLRRWLPSPLDRLGKTPPVVAWREGSHAILSNWMSQDSDLYVYRVDDGQMVTRLHGHTEPAASILMSPDGRIAFSGGSDKTIRAWDVERGECIGTISMDSESYRLVYAFREPAGGIRENLFGAHTTEGRRTAHPGPSWLRTWRLLVQHSFGAFAVLNASSGAKVREIHRSKVIREDFVGVLPDGFGVVATTGNSFWVFDVRTGQELSVFSGHSDIVRACAFHAGAQIAISSQWTGDSRLWVWDLVSGRIVDRLAGHNDEIKSVALSADGHYALSGSADKTIRVWDLRKLECVRTFYLDGPVDELSPPLANGIFCVSQGEWSFVLQLCRRWPFGDNPLSAVKVRED